MKFNSLSCNLSRNYFFRNHQSRNHRTWDTREEQATIVGDIFVVRVLRFEGKRW